MSEWCTWKCFLIGLVVGVVIGVAISWLGCDLGWVEFPGEPRPVPVPDSISGTIWRDSNANCVVDDGVPARLEGFRVEIQGPGGPYAATTGSDGIYTVLNIKIAGPYTVTVTNASTHVPRCDSDDVVPGPVGPTTPNQVIVNHVSGQFELADFGYN